MTLACIGIEGCLDGIIGCFSVGGYLDGISVFIDMDGVCMALLCVSLCWWVSEWHCCVVWCGCVCLDGIAVCFGVGGCLDGIAMCFMWVGVWMALLCILLWVNTMMGLAQ